MAIELSFLKSRLGRRAFWFFTGVLLIPIIVAAVLAVDNVSRRLAEQAHHQLHQSSKAYGMSLMERLLIVQDELRALRASLGDGQPDTRARHLSLFKGLALVEATGEARPLLAGLQTDDALLRQVMRELRGTSRTIASVPQSDRDAHVFMVLDERSGRKLVAQINPRFLWAEDYLLPDESNICVLDGAGATLFCSTPLPSQVLRRVAESATASANSVLDWYADDTAYLGFFWTLFAEPSFGANWILLASQTETDALAPISAFKRLFVPAITTLVVASLLLTLVQIRRRLAPLEQLMAGTRRIAARNFDQPLEVSSGDEFEDLGQAFNSMSTRLQAQFRTLETLSEIDQLILNDLDVESVVTLILERINGTVPCDCLAAAIVDRDNDQRARLMSVAGDDALPPEVQRIAWPAAPIQALLKRSVVIGLDDEPDDIELLARFRAADVEYLALLPIESETRLCGVICLGYRDRVELTTEDHKSLKDFADRAAVAIAAAEREEQLHHQAYYDSLTGLPNRQLFNDRLEQGMIRARRDDIGFALLFIDLDHFKKVNDTTGHPAGDLLLQQAAQRLRACLREGDTVARLGGDEFTVIVSGLAQPQDAAQLAADINKAFLLPFSIFGREYYVTNSIGIALYPDDGQTAKDLLKNADTAMYAAKEQGRDGYSFFEPQMNTDVTNRTSLEAELRQALARDELIVYYQPQVNAETGAVTGAEALLRWRHPKHGLVAPNAFIGIAEQSGLIEEIGRFVLRTACAQHAEWLRQGIMIDHLGVNIAPREFLNPQFVDHIRKLLAGTDLPSLALGLEITERLLMSNLDDTLEKLFQLKDLGVTLAVDDFGIGYSSLGYLRQFPIDTLKIDRSFLIDVTTNPDSAAIVRAILSIAKALELGVVAEGVEQRGQIEFLRAEGCHEIQGFFFARPMPPAEFAEFYNRHDPKAQLAAL